MNHKLSSADGFIDQGIRSMMKEWSPLVPPQNWEEVTLSEAMGKLKNWGFSVANPHNGNLVKKCCSRCDCFLDAPRSHNSRTNRSCMKIMNDLGIVVFVASPTEIICDDFRFEDPMTYTKYDNDVNQDQSFKKDGMKSIEIKRLSKADMEKTRKESIASIREILNRPPDMVEVNALYVRDEVVLLGRWRKVAHSHSFDEMIQGGVS